MSKRMLAGIRVIAVVGPASWSDDLGELQATRVLDKRDSGRSWYRDGWPRTPTGRQEQSKRSPRLEQLKPFRRQDNAQRPKIRDREENKEPVSKVIPMAMMGRERENFCPPYTVSLLSNPSLVVLAFEVFGQASAMREHWGPC